MLYRDIPEDILVEILKTYGKNEKFPSLQSICLRDMTKIIWKEYKNNWCKIVEYFFSLPYDLQKYFIYYLLIEISCEIV